MLRIADRNGGVDILVCSNPCLLKSTNIDNETQILPDSNGQVLNLLIAPSISIPTGES